MADAEYKKDILHKLLSDSQVHGYIRQKELDDLLDVIHNPYNIDTSLYDYSINLQVEKHDPQKKKQKNKRKSKRKTTHYLTEETFKNLNRTIKDIRKIVPEKYRSQISKTKIVNHSLNMILEEFQLMGEKSKIMQTVLQNLSIK
jgi:hypothetical protein